MTQRERRAQLLRWALLSTCAAGVVGLAACAPLPERELGVCGNNVYEPLSGEDCDGATERYGPGITCGGPTSNAPCRLTCSRQAQPTGCPSGWGCGVDGVCRQPKSELQLGSLPGQARAVGDLDGDGRDDVVLRGSAGEAQVAFFTEGRNIATVFVDPARRPISDSPVVLPIIGRMTSDSVDDLVLPLVGDDIELRVFIGSPTRELVHPFVELVTLPFGATGEVWMRTVFNAHGLPESLCAIGGCTQSLLLGKTKQDETRYAVLDDRTLVELFRLEDGRKRQNAALARWDQSRTCDVLAVSYRHDEATGSPGNLVDLFSLCAEPGSLNVSTNVDSLGTVAPLTSVGVANLDPSFSLILSGNADIDGDGRPDLLINITDNDPTTVDDQQTYALYGSGDGHFNSRVDQTGLVDLADLDAPLMLGHSFADGNAQTTGLRVPTWPRAAADINADGRADFMLNAGVAALSSPNPQDRCVLANETVLRGPPVDGLDEPQWGYVCMLITDNGLLDASVITRSQVSRDWLSSDSLATTLDLRGYGQPGFAAIDKNKITTADGSVNHSQPDFLDLLWVDPASSQLTLQSMVAERIEHIAAGDLDGDFAIDLLVGGHSLQTIWGPPYELARASKLSPGEFEVVQVFNEGRPSASLGAERDGRLTIFRDGQWPSLALVNPDECQQTSDCHVRAAVGALGDADNFSWALGVVEASERDGLRLLRAVTGQADLGPAYDAAGTALLSLDELGFSVGAHFATVIAAELDSGLDANSGENPEAAVDEALVIARGDNQLEIAVLRPSLVIDGSGKLCSGPFALAAEPGEQSDEQSTTAAVCFELVTFLTVPSDPRPHPGAEDPFVEIADADLDGNLDISWVTTSNTVMLLRGDGSGSLPTSDTVIELALPDADDKPPMSEDGPGLPVRIDWVRWIELDALGGRELVAADTLNAGRLWTFDARIDERELEVRSSVPLDAVDTSYLGYRGDFDGDGIDDIAFGEAVLFGQPVND